MDAETWQRVEPILKEALALEPDRRRAFVERQCADDEELREEVLELVEAYDDAGSFLAWESVGSKSEPSRPSLSKGDRVGPYKIRKQLGRGGMGEVFEAEQIEPIQRTVALKVVKSGMDTQRVIARFDYERQALALIGDHPHIATVFDAGETERGRPFFAMEFVSGDRITNYCDQHRVGLRQRIELFIQVCEGVQHAHRKGVIHRDLKPSNVLVAVRDGKPIPKIIDFGLAKATEKGVLGAAEMTRGEQLIGTLHYMSPEQAELSRRDVDTRSDVYSLGVLLYELLAGAHPYDWDDHPELGLDDMRRQLREVDPPRPSVRFGGLPSERQNEVASERAEAVHALRKGLTGELDWIVMRALEKDPTRRYDSPKALVDDLLRHLAGEPIEAGQPGAFYRLGKFLRRHRVAAALTASALVATVALAATVTSRTRARIETEVAAELSSFLIDLFGSSDPGVARGEQITAKEVLDKGADEIGRTLMQRPRTQARLMRVMGEVYESLSQFPEAERLHRLALEARLERDGSDHPDTLQSMQDLSEVLALQGKYVEAEPYFRGALEGRRRTLGDDHPGTLGSIDNMGDYFAYNGDYERAESFYRRAFEQRRRVLGEQAPETLASKKNLGSALREGNRLDEAEVVLLETLDAMRAVHGDDHPQTLETLNNLGVLSFTRGDYEDAESYYRTALDGYRRVLGVQHQDTLFAVNNLAIALKQLGRLEEAEPLYSEALEGRRAVLGERHPDTLSSMNNYGMFLAAGQRPEEAIPVLEQALDGLRQLHGRSHTTPIRAQGNLGDLYTTVGRYEEAKTLLHEGWQVLSDAGPNLAGSAAIMRRKYGRSLVGLGRYGEAEQALLGAHETLVVERGPRHLQTIRVAENLIELYEAWQRPAEARTWRERVTEAKGEA